jgi:hypothetical protein
MPLKMTGATAGQATRVAREPAGASGYAAAMDAISETPTEPRDYAALNLVWATLVGGMLAATREREAPPYAELPVLGLASFSLAKALSKEKVGVWARLPMLERGPDGERRPKGRGLRFAVGELLTCPRCLGTWSSLGLMGLRIARPREGRIVTSILATAALNDVLQTGFSYLCSKANATDSDAQVAGQEAQAGRAADLELAAAPGH